MLPSASSRLVKVVQEIMSDDWTFVPLGSNKSAAA
jgi:hypothetical protein